MKVGIFAAKVDSRLKNVGLFSLKGRLLRLDLIKVWKCFHAETDIGLIRVLELATNVGTRGHDFKLSIPVCRSELGRRTFGARVVRAWNSLPSQVVEAATVEVFKTRLDSIVIEELFSFD